MEASDFLLDKDGDLMINPNTGDFQIGLSDDQHIQDIIESFPGWWKEFPSIGVGILQYLNSSGQEQQIERSIKLQLTADGYEVSRPDVSVTIDGITYNPNAIRR